MKIQFLLIVLFAVVISCKTDKVYTFENENVQKFYTKYKSDPTEQNARLFSASAIQYLSTTPDALNKKDLLDEGLAVSKKHNITSGQITFLIILIRDYQGEKETPDRIFELASVMKTGNKEAAVNTLLHSFINSNKNHPKVKEAKEMMTAEISDIDDYILQIGEKIFDDPDETGVNRDNSLFYVDACEAYALANPNNVGSPEFLYKASEIARTLRTFPKALSLYDWIIQKYPNYEKTPTTLFLKGFLLENEFQDIEAAKIIYIEFKTKYPNHQLADDVDFLIENIGKSDEEIMEIIEKRRESQ